MTDLFPKNDHKNNSSPTSSSRTLLFPFLEQGRPLTALSVREWQKGHLVTFETRPCGPAPADTPGSRDESSPLSQSHPNCRFTRTMCVHGYRFKWPTLGMVPVGTLTNPCPGFSGRVALGTVGWLVTRTSGPSEMHAI